MRVTTLLIVVLLVGGGAYYGWKQGYFGKAQKAADESFAVHLDKGQGLYQTQKYDDAIKELDKALQLDPKNPDAAIALMRTGDCYKELNQPQKAIEYYERVIKEFPNFKMRGQVEQSIEKVRSLGKF